MRRHSSFPFSWWLRASLLGLLVTASAAAITRADGEAANSSTTTTPTTSIPANSTVKPAPVTPSDSASSDAAPAQLEHGLDLERARNWAGAIDLYRKALEQWPNRVEFSRRLRLCEIHFKIQRRYNDTSFRRVLLKLPREQAIDLYNEVIERIESNYVDRVPFEPLVRHGLDNLEVALRDPVFLKNNSIETTPERITWLRDQLRAYRAKLVIPDRDEAVKLALTSCELASQAIRLESTAVLLEFTYGACDALDDFTSYLTPDKLEDLYAMIDGNFVGLGIELKSDKDGLRLVGVIRGGPAWEAGLIVGDHITAVGPKRLKGLSLDEAANLLQGTEGSTVSLEVQKRDNSIQSLTLTRRHVEVESITKVKMVEPVAGIGYLQMTGFQKTTTDELDRAVASLVNEGMRILVVDLRGNPGGLLNVAVEIAERFIESGLIVSTRGRAQGQSQAFSANGQVRWKMPLYVLVDHDSASASEILAGALQDHRRATILGARTYGKGSVQSIFSLKSAPAGLKLTTAKFYSPLNRPYSEQGVSPDFPITVRAAAKPSADGSSSMLEESNIGDPVKDPVLAAAIRKATSVER